MANRFPKFEMHEHAACYWCGVLLTGHRVSEFPSGKYRGYCIVCSNSTFYECLQGVNEFPPDLEHPMEGPLGRGLALVMPMRV